MGNRRRLSQPPDPSQLPSQVNFGAQTSASDGSDGAGLPVTPEEVRAAFQISYKNQNSEERLGLKPKQEPEPAKDSKSTDTKLKKKNGKGKGKS